MFLHYVRQAVEFDFAIIYFLSDFVLFSILFMLMAEFVQVSTELLAYIAAQVNQFIVDHVICLVLRSHERSIALVL